jgi:hypothetical protein
MHVKAISVVCFPGFRILLRGEVCEVPADYEIGARSLADRGQVEIVTVAAEPSGNEAPAVALSPAPAALVLTDETDEEARLRAELEQLEAQENAAVAPPPPPAPPAGRAEQVCKHCGKKYSEHAKKPAGAAPGSEAFACKGIKRFVEADSAALSAPSA